MKYKNIILGHNSDYNELIFGEFEITHRNGYREFTAMFHTDEPVNVSDYDKKEEMQNLLDDCYDSAAKYELCERYDCRPLELAEIMAEECSVDEMIDNSLFNEHIHNKLGEEYIFQANSCGQHDTRGEITTIYCDELYELINEMWDKWHLKKLPDSEDKKLNRLCELAEEWSDPIRVEEYAREYISRTRG